MKRGVVHWNDETKNRRRRPHPVIGFSPADEFKLGALFVSQWTFDVAQNEQWDTPTAYPSRKHKKKNVTVLIYAGPIRVQTIRPDKGVVTQVKHTFIMGGGRYIIDAFERIKPGPKDDNS